MLCLACEQVWQCVDKNTLKIMDCNDACTVHSSCAVHPNQQCDSSIIYDTPHISLHPAPSSCTLECHEKSGACH